MKFEPVCYEHAAYLLGKTPWEVSRDRDLLVRAHLEAMNKYNNTTCIVGLDIYNVEAEAYGCTLDEPQDNDMPAFRTPLLGSLEDVMSLKLDPATDGRMPMLLDAARRIAEARPQADIRIAMAGPFSIACHLFGLENTICELFINPASTTKVLLHLAENQITWGRAITDAGFGISMFESSVAPPLLSPKLFSDSVLPALQIFFDALNGQASSGMQLIIGGDTVHIAKAIFSLDPAYIICPVETDQIGFMAAVDQNQGCTIRVNMNPFVFLQRHAEDALTEAERVRGLAAKYQNTTAGTLLPFDANPDIVQEIAAFFETTEN